MIAATLYEKIKGKNSKEHRFQKEILNLWKKSWRNNGFQTIVLTEKDFSNSDAYKDFCYRMEVVNKEIYKQLQPNIFKNRDFLWNYSISCWKRWFLFSELNLEEPFYCGDYDVINNSLTPDNCHISDRMTLLDGICPCWASGTSKQFRTFCDLAAHLSEKNISKIKNFFKKEKIYTFYTDLRFCQINYKEEEFVENFDVTHDKKFLNGTHVNYNSKLIHFSHHFTNLNCDGYSDVARVKIIKDFLSKKGL